jgi:hypothetical protein
MVTKGRARVDVRLDDHRVVRSPLLSPLRIDEHGEKSPHPCRTRRARPGALVLPLLRAPRLCLLLGTAPVPVGALFLIHLAFVLSGALVRGGLVNV